MSELTARLAIYGAVDVAITEEDRDRGEVARVLPIYARPPEEIDFWFDAFQHAAGIDLVAGVMRGLGEMRNITDLGTIEAAHRFEALWVAWSLFRNEHDTEEDEFDEAIDAAAGPVVSPGTGAERLRVEFERVGTIFDGPVSPSVAAEAIASAPEGVITLELARLVGGCQEGTVYYKVPGSIDDIDVGAQLVSSFEIPLSEFGLVDVPTLKAAIQPPNWPSCHPFWLSMTAYDCLPDTSQGQDCYIESVGEAPGAEWFRPCLRFQPAIDIEPGGGFAMLYDMCTNPPVDDITGELKEQRILVDAGIIQLRLTDDPGNRQLLVSTTKTIAFTERVPSAGLALFACVSGWLDQSKAMITGCLTANLPP